MHYPGNVVGHTVESAIETFHTILKRHIQMAHKQWFINLNKFATRLDQRAYFKVQCVGQIESEFAFTFIVNVSRSIDGRQRAGQGDFFGLSEQRWAVLKSRSRK